MTVQGGTGLFGATGEKGTGGEHTAQLININLDAVTIKQTEGESYHCVGALVGTATATDIRNCHVLSGNITGYNNVGGLIGHFAGADSTNAYIISGCSSNANVYGRDVGGLVGQFGIGVGTTKEPLYTGNVQMYDCFATGTVQSMEMVLGVGSLGGLISSGKLNNIGRVQHCYTSVTITALPSVAGIGDVRVGGLIGDPGIGSGVIPPRDLQIENNVVLTPSMSGVATESGYQYGRVGGLEKRKPNELAAVFKNNYVTAAMLIDGQPYAGTSGDDANGTTKTAAELAQQATWETLGFDFSEMGKWQWDAAAGRPVLKKTTATYEIQITEQPQDAIAFANRPASSS